MIMRCDGSVSYRSDYYLLLQLVQQAVDKPFRYKLSSCVKKEKKRVSYCFLICLSIIMKELP